MTYRQLRDAIKHIKMIKQMRKDTLSAYPKDENGQRAIPQPDYGELQRLDAMLDEEVPGTEL